MMMNDGDEDLGSDVLVTDLSGDSFDGFDLGDGNDGGDEFSSADMDAGTEGVEAGQTDGVDPASSQPDPSGQPPATQQTQTGQQPPAGQQPQTPPPDGSQQQGQQPPQTGQPQQPADFVSYVRDNAETIVEHMANNQFKLTDAEAEAMGDAAPVVSRYMARSHLVSMANVVTALNKALPMVVGNLIKISNDSAAVEQRFFGQYPQLKNVDRQQLSLLAGTLRQANPTATADQFLPLLARTIAAMNGIQLPPVRGKPQPHTPAAAQQRGQSPTPGGQQRRTVSTHPLQGINEALRDGE